ncbi:MAG TPA: hypothetical protein VG986_09425 [Pseudolabrys sp.]|nr:hypothetical protein [Pseudolabrys sp.]
MSRNLKRADFVIDPVASDRNNNAWEVIRTLVNGGADSSRLLELYYWSQEPGIVELVRAYLEMNERARLAMGNFLLSARPQSIAAALDTQGRLVLSRPSPGNGRSDK